MLITMCIYNGVSWKFDVLRRKRRVINFQRGNIPPSIESAEQSILTPSFALAETSAIQNDKTTSRLSRENIVLSASAYTGPEKTSSVNLPGVSLNFQKTVPAFQLESSKSVNGYDREEARFVFKDMSHDESIDELTSSKHMANIDGNNIEVKPGEYYQ